MVNSRNHQIYWAFCQLIYCNFYAVNRGAGTAVGLISFIVWNSVDSQGGINCNCVSHARLWTIGSHHKHIAQGLHAANQRLYAGGKNTIVVANEYQRSFHNSKVWPFCFDSMQLKRDANIFRVGFSMKNRIFMVYGHRVGHSVPLLFPAQLFRKASQSVVFFQYRFKDAFTDVFKAYLRLQPTLLSQEHSFQGKATLFKCRFG